MKVLEKNKAIELRKQGKTFGEIMKELPVSKSSLSYWLKDIKLTNEQIARIKYKNNIIKKKFIKFNKLKRRQSERNKKFIIKSAIREIKNVLPNELKLIGIALYWAEGYKGSSWRTLSFANSDPHMIKLMMKWFREVCKVPDWKFRIRIQVHGPEKVKTATNYWSKITGLPLPQFSKPYVRVSSTSKKRKENIIPNGVCNIRISDVAVLTKIKGWIQGLKALSSSLD